MSNNRLIIYYHAKVGSYSYHIDIGCDQKRRWQCIIINLCLCLYINIQTIFAPCSESYPDIVLFIGANRYRIPSSAYIEQVGHTTMLIQLNNFSINMQIYIYVIANLHIVQVSIDYGTTVCLVTVTESDDTDIVAWILGNPYIYIFIYFIGDPWIRQYCNVYDVGGKRIGFAKSFG